MVVMAHTLALDIWMNGLFVGTWERPKGIADRLIYDPEWIHSAQDGRYRCRYRSVTPAVKSSHCVATRLLRTLKT